jgi:CRISPR-associated protein Csy2
MTECPYFDHLLVIPRLHVQNANAMSSPLTHGFPSMTAFLGLLWALERKTRAAGLDLQFNAVGVVCHSHQEQITDGGFVNAFRLTRNPISKDGGAAAIVEEGRIHLELSLVFAVQSVTLTTTLSSAENIVTQIRDLLLSMRIAGGSVIPSMPTRRRQLPYVVALTGDEQGRDKAFNQTKLRLLPGFTLVGRDDLLQQRIDALRAENPNASKLDAWLSLSRINWRNEEVADSDTKPPKVQWIHDRKKLGWVVPIPVGYGALTELQEPGSVANARDATTPFRFVESLYSIGQWLSPHRLQSPQQLLWYADSQPDNGLYRCRNDYRTPQMYDFD